MRLSKAQLKALDGIASQKAYLVYCVGGGWHGMVLLHCAANITLVTSFLMRREPMPSIDETELARLEALAAHSANVVTLDNVSIPHQIIKSVPTLVAEVRRLRACNTIRFADFEHHLESAQAKEIEALREKVEAWEWWEEVRTYDPWSEHPYCTACGNRSKRGKIFDCAVDEYEKIKSTAREAVHADRE